MWPIIVLFLYCLLLIVASLAGGCLPSLVRLTHTRMQLMMSLVGGLMMGVALLHLLPHAVVETSSLDYAAWSCMSGLLAMFLIIRVFQVHQHGPPNGAIAHDEQEAGSHAHHDCQHPAHHAEAGTRQLSWIGLFVGLAIHSLLDGVAVGASVVAGVQRGTTWGLLGAGTFLAVLLHKPLDSLSITSVMAVGHWGPRSQNVINAFFSLICPLGACLTYFGVQEFGPRQHVAVGCTRFLGRRVPVHLTGRHPSRNPIPSPRPRKTHRRLAAGRLAGADYRPVRTTACARTSCKWYHGRTST